MKRIRIQGEKQFSGSPGQFLLGKAEVLCPRLLESYASQVRLIYLDPPFGTGDTFSMRIGKQKINVPAYTDTLSEADYRSMMQTVLRACYELLSPDGSLYLHVDYRKSAMLRIMLDDIFGEENFVNEIIWAYRSGGRSTRYYPRKHDNILFYRKSSKQYFNIQAVGSKRGAQRRNHLKRSVSEDGRIAYSIRSAGKTYTYYEDDLVSPSDVWDDIEHLHQRDPERTGYATQKPEALLKRILSASSEPGDLVMDLFSGSGTTAATAAQLNRTWVAADASPLALSTLRRRIVGKEQNASMLNPTHSMSLIYNLNNLESPGANIEANGESYIITPSDNNELDYIALGYADEGIFLPQSFMFSPRNDAFLKIQKKGSPVLQAVDLYGRQGFWALD